MTEQQVLPPLAGGAVPHVGTYRRVLPVSLERMYENTLDWEHLPHVHAGSFGSIECLDSGPWGWRAALTSAAGAPSEIELRLDRPLRRWITRNITGPAAGAEIWTHVFVEGARELQINVDFFVPGVAPEQREKVGKVYANLYAQLYDEDVAMMVERQRQLDQRMDRADAAESMDIGPLAQLPERSTHRYGGRDLLVVREGDEVFAVPALCPHQLGPLQQGEISDGCVTCPWHGYAFDLRSGECRSGQSLRLHDLPQVSVVAGRVLLSLP
ncbi:MAG: Rieske (2Fe-2S) protein [Pseudomonadales bacterium]